MLYFHTGMHIVINKLIKIALIKRRYSIQVIIKFRVNNDARLYIDTFSMDLSKRCIFLCIIEHYVFYLLFFFSLERIVRSTYIIKFIGNYFSQFLKYFLTVTQSTNE